MMFSKMLFFTRRPLRKIKYFIELNKLFFEFSFYFDRNDRQGSVNRLKFANIVNIVISLDYLWVKWTKVISLNGYEDGLPYSVACSCSFSFLVSTKLCRFGLGITSIPRTWWIFLKLRSRRLVCALNVIDSRSCCVQLAIRSRCPASTTEIKPPQPRRKVPPAIVDMNRRRQSPKIIIKSYKIDSYALTCSLWHTNSSQRFDNGKFHWPSSKAIPVTISSDNILVINLEEYWCSNDVVLLPWQFEIYKYNLKVVEQWMWRNWFGVIR